MKLVRHCVQCPFKSACKINDELDDLMEFIDHAYYRLPLNNSEWALKSEINFNDDSDGIILNLECPFTEQGEHNNGC